MKFVDPKNDIAFKKRFGDPNKTEILISFLNAVLELPSPIASLAIASPYQIPQIEELENLRAKPYQVKQVRNVILKYKLGDINNG